MQNTLILAIGQAVCGIPRNTEDCHEQHLPDGAKARIGKGFTIGSIKFSDDGKLTVIPCSIGIWMYDTKTDKPLNLLTGHTSWVRSVAFSPDGSLLASVGDDGTVRTWDVHSGTLLFTLFDNYSLVFSIAFSPDGKTLAGLGVLGTVYLWNVGSGELMWTIEVHQEESYTIAFSPDGKTLASAGLDKTVRLWDARTGTHLRTLDAHRDAVKSVAFSPDGKTLASGSSDGTVLLWDLMSDYAILTKEEEAQ